MKIRSFFFLFLFTAFLLAPVVLRVCDNEADLTEFFSMNEEEKADTSFVDTEKQTPSTINVPDSFLYGDAQSSLAIHYMAFWNALYLDTSYPPPEA